MTCFTIAKRKHDLSLITAKLEELRHEILLRQLDTIVIFVDSSKSKGLDND